MDKNRPKSILKPAGSGTGKCLRCMNSKEPKDCTPTAAGSCLECQEAHKQCSEKVLALAHRRAAALAVPKDMAEITQHFGLLSVLIDDNTAEMEQMKDDLEVLKARPSE